MSARQRQRCVVKLPTAQRVRVAPLGMIVRFEMTDQFVILDLSARNAAIGQNVVLDLTATFAMTDRFGLSAATVETEPSDPVTTGMIARLAITAPRVMIAVLSCAVSARVSTT